MIHEAQGWPISAGAMIAVGIHVGSSLFITGPTVAERTVRKSGWIAECERSVAKHAEAREAPVTTEFIPNMMQCTIDMRRNPLIAKYCDMADQAVLQKHRAQQALIDQRKARIAAAASRAGSRCECALSVSSEQDRIDWAIYAGSLRLVTPNNVRSRDARMSAALSSSSCSMKE